MHERMVDRSVLRMPAGELYHIKRVRLTKAAQATAQARQARGWKSSRAQQFECGHTAAAPGEALSSLRRSELWFDCAMVGVTDDVTVFSTLHLD